MRSVLEVGEQLKYRITVNQADDEIWLSYCVELITFIMILISDVCFIQL